MEAATITPAAKPLKERWRFRFIFPFKKKTDPELSVGVHKFTGVLLIPGRFAHGSAGKESTGNVGDTGDVGLIPALGISPGEGNGNPLQHSCLKKSLDRGARWATVHGVTKSQIQLSDQTHMLLTQCSFSCSSGDESKDSVCWRRGLGKIHLCLELRVSLQHRLRNGE